MCLAKLLGSLLLTALYSLKFSAFTYLRRINYHSATVNISVFMQLKKHFNSEWYFPKNHEIGSPCLVMRKLKNATHMRLTVESRELWAWTSLGSWRAILLLIPLSCVLPGQVKKLQKFVNLKVGHSANLKHSKSTWRQLIILWKTQNHNIKGSGNNVHSALLDRGTYRSDRCMRVVILILGAFV